MSDDFPDFSPTQFQALKVAVSGALSPVSGHVGQDGEFSTESLPAVGFSSLPGEGYLPLTSPGRMFLAESIQRPILFPWDLLMRRPDSQPSLGC
jgi:hypothetical protein